MSRRAWSFLQQAGKASQGMQDALMAESGLSAADIGVAAGLFAGML